MQKKNIVAVFPTISVIIPAKNEQKYIANCIAGILASNYPFDKLEIIVIDNNSSDNTAQVARKCGASVITEPQGPIGRLRNRGAEVAQGIYLAFVDADCIISPIWFERSIIRFEKNSETIAIGAKEAPPHSSSTWVEQLWTDLKHGAAPESGYKNSSWCASGAVIVKGEDFWAVSGFNNELETCEDVDFSSRLLRGGRHVTIDFNAPFQHLRGSKTLSELFRRERWRGGDNISGITKHGLSMKELPSILIPFLFTFSCFGSLLSFTLCLATNITWIVQTMWIFVFFVIFFPLLMLIKKAGYFLLSINFPRYYLICFIYLLARGCGIFCRGRRTWIDLG